MFFVMICVSVLITSSTINMLIFYIDIAIMYLFYTMSHSFIQTVILGWKNKSSKLHSINRSIIVLK